LKKLCLILRESPQDRALMELLLSRLSRIRCYILRAMMAQLLIILLLAMTLPQTAAFQSFQQPPAEEAFNRAVELQRQGKWDETVAAWRAFLKLEPKHAGAHANLGTALSRLNQHEAAIASFETALKLNPALTPLLYNLGIAHFRAGQFAKAAESLTGFLNLNPNFPPARQLLGLALVELGRDEEAVPQIEATLASSPNDTAALYALGLALLRLRRAEFKGVAERLAALPGGIALSQMLSGQSFLRENDYRRATESFTAAAKLDPELPRLQFSLGVALLRQGRHGEAALAFEKELAKLPRDFWTLYYLAYLREAEGQLNSAREKLKAALAVEPRSVEANALLGKILLRQNKAAEAVAPLEVAVAEKPGDSNTRFLLARAYQQSGRRADAAREFAEVQRLKNQGIEKERRGAQKPE
jgi:tetratricopeptide (TPR) repeat protein